MTSRLIIRARNNNFPFLSGAPTPSPGALEAAAHVVLPARAAALNPRACPPFVARNWTDRARSVPFSSGMQPDAGPAAVLRFHPTEEQRHLTVQRRCRRPSASGPAAVPPSHAAGLLLDAVTVALGMIVFGAIAYTLLVL